MNQVIVTGANGYLGGHIFSNLRMKDMDVLSLGRSGHCDITCDLRDHAITKNIIEQYPDSHIIHCAAAVPKSHSDYFDEVAASESLEMVRNLVNANPRHIIFTSSMTVYPEGTVLAKEEDTVLTGKGYSASKLEAERILLECSAVTSTILRLPGLFGLPRQNGVLFNSALALARGDTPFLEKILPQWAAMHVEDASDICTRAVLNTPKNSMVINVGYPVRMAIPDAVKQLAVFFGRELSLPASQWFTFDLSRLDTFIGPVSESFSKRLKDLADWACESIESGHSA